MLISELQTSGDDGGSGLGTLVSGTPNLARSAASFRAPETFNGFAQVRVRMRFPVPSLVTVTTRGIEVVLDRHDKEPTGFLHVIDPLPVLKPTDLESDSFNRIFLQDGSSLGRIHAVQNQGAKTETAWRQPEFPHRRWPTQAP